MIFKKIKDLYFDNNSKKKLYNNYKEQILEFEIEQL